jgi:hypothetical protein
MFVTSYKNIKIKLNIYIYNIYIYFKCRIKNCSASVTIDQDETLSDRIHRLNDNHNHGKTASDADVLINNTIAEMKILAEVDDIELEEINNNCFNQCLYRKLVQLGLKTAYDEDDEFRMESL